MKLLSRYLLRELRGPFLFALGALTGLMLLNQIARQFDDLVGKGLSWAVILEVFALSVPFIVAMTLPMAVLVAVLFAFTRLGADNEITALKAGGVDLVRLVRPVLLAACGLALVNFAFNDQVLPRSNHELKTLLIDIARKKPTFELREQMVNEVIPGQYFLRAGRIDQAADRLREVVIYDLSNDDRRRTIYADSGYMRFNDERTDLHLTLYDGFVHDYDEAQPGLFRRVFFSTDHVRLRGVSNQLERTGFDASKGDREMTVCEMEAVALDARRTLRSLDREAALQRENDLRSLLGVVERTDAPASTPSAAPFPSVAPYCRALGILGRWLSPAPARADTVVRDGQRVNPIGRARAAERRARLVQGRVPFADRRPPPRVARPETVPAPAVVRAPPDLGGARLGEQRSVQAARRRAALAQLMRYQVEIHKKFAIPAMCIAFVIIGAPLALRFPRGGVGLVIGASSGIFGLYYVGLIGGESLADKLVIAPFWAMWTPNLLMTAAGLVLFSRLGREHATSRGSEWADRLADALDRWRARRRGA